MKKLNTESNRIRCYKEIWMSTLQSTSWASRNIYHYSHHHNSSRSHARSTLTAHIARIKSRNRREVYELQTIHINEQTVIGKIKDINATPSKLARTTTIKMTSCTTSELESTRVHELQEQDDCCQPSSTSTRGQKAKSFPTVGLLFSCTS